MHCVRYVLVHEADCESSQSSCEPEHDSMVWVENHHHHMNQCANYSHGSHWVPQTVKLCVIWICDIVVVMAVSSVGRRAL